MYAPRGFCATTLSAVMAMLLVSHALAGQQAPPRRPVPLDVASRVSAERVVPGERFTIALDLTPAPKMHVYALGVVGYEPIAFTIRPQPGVLVREISYPPAETYFYAPLKETVAVYQKPFRIVQEIALDSSPAGRAALKGISTVTIQGTLTYQACDDRVCFPPRTVPMTWTVSVKES